MTRDCLGSRRGDRLPQAFFAREADLVARELIGTILVRSTEGASLAVRIVETEAYVGPHDLACHAARGRTARTEVMFGPAGHAYVYLIYGMHHMLNFVTGRRGSAQAVLIRAGEPLPEGSGMNAAGLRPPGPTNGPGRLTRSMGITLEDNGADLRSDGLHLLPGRAPDSITVTSRVGVDYAGEWAEAPLRFYDPASSHVSRR